MPDFSLENQALLQAILNTGAAQPQSTLSTGTDFGTQQQTQPTSPFIGQLPSITSPVSSNQNYQGTINRFFTPQQPGQPSNFRFPQSPPNHTIGRDDLQSRMGLTHDQILNNLGLNKQ